MTLDGQVTVLHSFHGADGRRPRGGLIEASDGRLYGSAPNDFGLGLNLGTIYSIGPLP